MFGNSGPFSYVPRGLPQDDDLRGPTLQRTMSRPSGKSIYMQRREYSETLNRQQDSLINVRVEHLLTCELDGQSLRTVEDCVAKLSRLEAKGSLWSQNMIMDMQGPYLLLSDIETKAELESIPLSFVTGTKHVEDSGALYNSLLAITVQDRYKRIPQVFIFQCEETSGDVIKAHLDKAVQRVSGLDLDSRREPADLRGNLENIISHQAVGSFRQPAPYSGESEWKSPPPDRMNSQWSPREPEYTSFPRVRAPQEDMMHPAELYEAWDTPEILPEQLDIKRSEDIFNHIIGDLELFMDKVSAALKTPPQENKNKKKKKLKKAPPPDYLPNWEEYISFLQKTKFGFNLLGQLEGVLVNVTAPDYTHFFFTYLNEVTPLYPPDLPATVVAPLLTEEAIEMLGKVLGREEYALWRSLGNAWFTPRSEWTESVPSYFPQFYDGWQPPTPSPRQSPRQNDPVSRSNSHRFSDRAGRGMNENPPLSPRANQRQPEESLRNGSWNSMPPEPVQRMRAMYDFNARNNKELSIMRGELVQVVQKTRQWWLVRNSRGEEGNVPLNVLESVSSGTPAEDFRHDNYGAVTLDRNSSPAEVKAWLESKGFSRITSSSLGVLSGRELLGMSKDEIRMVCPEEGGRVFFQLQSVKSSIALASEQVGMYNSRY